jgi:hypothetical protein
VRKTRQQAPAAGEQQQVAEEASQRLDDASRSHHRAPRSRSTSAQRARSAASFVGAEKRNAKNGDQAIKTPGEILSRFFLNYKKDRKALFDRLVPLCAITYR